MTGEEEKDSDRIFLGVRRTCDGIGRRLPARFEDFLEDFGGG